MSENEKNLRVAIHQASGIVVREDGMFLTASGRWSKGASSGSGSGYLNVKRGNKKWYIHRLIAECFIPNPYNKPTVDHIDRNKQNNSVSNLRFATHREQRDNSGVVINRADYGVRWCEDKKQYMHNWYLAHRGLNGRAAD